MCIKILLKNCYPLSFVFETIENRLRNIFARKQTKKCNTTCKQSDEQELYFVIPYVHSISEKFKNIAKKINHRIAYTGFNKMNNIIKVHKDPLKNDNKCNIIYKIDCNNCDASYVGQTSRQLQTRIKEHRNHIRWNSGNRSVITEHRLEFDHDFKWDDIRLLDREPILTKRLTSEMLFIKRQENSINLQTDTELLPDIYLPLINKLPKL